MLFILQEMPSVIPLRRPGLFAATELPFALPCVEFHGSSQGKLGCIHPAASLSFIEKNQAGLASERVEAGVSTLQEKTLIQYSG